MPSFQLWAEPWWVNLLILIPFVTFFAFRKGLALNWRQLMILAVFATAFGFVEGAVVVYLRSAIGLLPGYTGTLSELQHSSEGYHQERSLAQFPPSLLSIEVSREAATIVMLVCVALLTSPLARARWAAFLWTFAIWDSAYYAGLWTIVRWPASFKDLDILFLIPVPWIAQVWFPLLVSMLTVAVIALLSGKRSTSPALHP
jgi:hypothetical protein